MEVKPGFARGKVLLLGSESIGRGDDDLGYEILLTMLKTLAGRDAKSLIFCFIMTSSIFRAVPT